MKKILLLMAAAMMVTSVFAAPVDQTTAQRKAQKFLASELYAGKIMAPEALTPVLVKAEMGDAKLGQPVYYIFNTSTTFLVIAGDDRAEEILMIGDESLDLKRIPDAMYDILNIYKEQIMFLQEHPGLKVDPNPGHQNTTSLRAVTYGPLLTCNWDQEAPYYNQCKFTYNGTTYQCVTGCPATSAAMVMYYWRYPTAEVSGVDSYRNTLEYSSNGSTYFTYPALGPTTFDWNNMKDSYRSGYTNAQANAVATLMRYVGQAEHMAYGVNGSGIYTTQTQNVVDMFTLFGYNSSTCRLIKKSSYNEASWASLIQNEMAASRPVVYCAVDANGSGGHAFNVDGYRSSDNKYHVNFGWSGTGNNWYAMNAFSYSSWGYTYTYTSDQRAVIGIQPPSADASIMLVNPTSLTFEEGSTGNTYTQTFEITGANLKNDVYITSNSSNFTVSPSTVTPSQVASGVTITVTYAPTMAGVHTGNITVSCEGVNSRVVTVSGSAVQTPCITASPTMLNFNTSVGSPVSKTIDVSAVYLTENIAVTVEGQGFSVDKTSIGRIAASNGTTLTVTYNPTALGNNHGTVTLSSAGAESVTIDLSGVSDGMPTLSVSPTSLSLETSVGQMATKSFTVTGVNLIGNVYLSVSGTGFSIDKSTINKSLAGDGVVVNVFYRPTAAGTHTGTITLSSSSAQSVTVSLNGTAAGPPKITVNPDLLMFNTMVGEPVTDTFVVTGTNLTGDLTLEMDDASGVFSVDPITITAEEAMAGKTVTVTYATTECDSHFASVIISGGGASAVTVDLEGEAEIVKYVPVMLPASADYVTSTGFRADWTDETPLPCISYYVLELTGATTQTISGLSTDEKFYEFVDLTPASTYLYRVRARFVDGSMGTWSNQQSVTLLAPEHDYELGDVNHDRVVDVSDVTMLISAVLVPDAPICNICGDINGDQKIDVSDVTMLIAIVLQH